MSAILIGKLSNRAVFHNWTVEPAQPHDIEIIRHMRAATLDTFFEPSPAIPFVALDESSPIDVVFSEWGPGESWFSRQSSAIQRCNWRGPVTVQRDNADSILECAADTVLLEHSRVLKPSFMSAAEHDAALTEIYAAHFEPLTIYRKLTDALTAGAPYVGVHVRRNDHLRHVRGANIRVQDWVELVGQHVRTEERLYLCSDDSRFVARIAAALRGYQLLTVGTSDDATPRTKAFLEFLILSRATRIYGTIGSSFSKEAARFGSTPIMVCRSNRPGLIAGLRSWVGLERSDEPAIRFVT